MLISKKIKVTCLLLGILFLSQLCYTQTYPFDTIMNRINADIHSSDVSSSTLDGRVLSAKNSMINNDSSWADVNYTTGDGNHLARVMDFSRAYTRSSSAYFNDADIYKRLVKALWYWYRRNPVHSNWWYNEISFPQQIGKILILMRYGVPSLPSNLENNFITRMTKGNPYAQTGANKTDIALHFLYRSCLIARTSLLDTAAMQSFEPIKMIHGGEGLQYDNSYFQHGSQLAIASYGSVFINNAYTAASYLKGTPFELSSNQLLLLSKYTIDTYNNTIRGKYFDFSVQGRGISRPNALQAGSNYSKQKFVDPASNTAWDAATARITQQQPPSYMITPLHTHYWRGDYDIHQRARYLFTIRTVSTRTVRTERGNNENILGKFLPDGATTIMRSGAEYFNIFPVWEWDKVPGITSRDFATDQPITVDWGQAGNTSFVGGVSDSLYGVSTYDQNFNGVTVKKSWFFFDNEVVCLGAGINSTQPETVTTTINQSWLTGDVHVAEAGIVKLLSPNTTLAFSSPQWVLHDSTGYFFPSGGNTIISNQPQSGNWNKINQGQSSSTITGNVFKLWFNHGAQPAGGKYAYIVAPGISSVSEMQNYAVSNLKIIANSDSVQAVRNLQQHMMQIVFHKAGSLTDDSVTITVDKPCIVLLRQLNTNQVSVHIADPVQSITNITVSLITPQISGKKYLVAQMPPSPFAGATTRIIFDNNSPDTIIPIVPDSSIISIADSYVRNGSYAGSNYGTATGLPVKTDGAGYTREAWFKFDLHNIRTTPDSVRLRLYCTGGNAGAETTQWALYKMDDNSWTESGINWNNKPATGTLVATRPGQSTAGYVDWDISALMSSIPSDSLISFRMVSTVTGSTTDASFSSKEAEINSRPAILLKYAAIKTDSIETIADVYVRDGSYANSNFGNASLVVKKDGTGYTRETYLKFDVSSLRGELLAAKLRLNISGANTGAGTTSWVLLKSDYDSWTETGITWNNKPAITASVDTIPGRTAPGYCEWDILNELTNISGDSLFTFKIISTTTGSATDVSFSSRENTNARLRPSIIYTTDTSVPEPDFAARLQHAITVRHAEVAQEQLLLPEIVKVVPNPAHGTAKIQFLGLRPNEIYRIEVLNILGNVISGYPGITSKGINQKDINLERFSNGEYIIRIVFANKIITGRLIKIK